MDTEHLQDALARYVRRLVAAAESTSNASDRPLYISHLAEAARLFAELRTGNAASVRDIVVRERRAFGWSFLAGQDGNAVEEAWLYFASLVDRWVEK